MSSLTDRHWSGRSHPWCVYTRLAAAVALVLAVYSYRNLGVYALVPVGIVLVFIALNPFVFPAPRTDTAWATRAVLGHQQWRKTRSWDRPTLYRILSALCYLPALLAAFEGMLWESMLLALVALG